MKSAITGSSPLARGLQLAEAGARNIIRIIPARAEFTNQYASTETRTGDHPRSRGVYDRAKSYAGRATGSSPLARGLPKNSNSFNTQLRIIPARAGFTDSSRSRSTAWWDHPRSRGVYPERKSEAVYGQGSSPLARGLRCRDDNVIVIVRIIPARAGFTGRSSRTAASPGDHPRSRGVYDEAGRPEQQHTGSSPLARGLPLVWGADSYPRRIIPARAGFTGEVPPAVAPVRDHPRSRGVYDVRPGDAVTFDGSSPLARGLPQGPLLRILRIRIIPARAGFTPSACREIPFCGDHPRSRGVYSCPYQHGGRTGGSSPLARGLPDRPRRHRHRLGIIPARAGFTTMQCQQASRSRDHPRSRGVYCGWWVR